MVHQSMIKLLEACDNSIAGACARLFRNSPALLIFTFHSLFASPEEIARGLLDPQQGITTQIFSQFVRDFTQHGYRFVSPREILDGPETEAKAAIITFDDGYYNNVRAVPVLEEFQIPAVFCISTSHVATGKAFWWDTLYRESRTRGWSSLRTDHVRAALKLIRSRDAERHLCSEFGEASLRPVSDLDRPLTSKELVQLASHPLVHIGNHTVDHAILSNYSPTEIKEQIAGAQDFIRGLTGKSPELIAYPNGNVSAEIVRMARDGGLRLGVTVQPGRNLIADARSFHQSMQLKRFTLWAQRNLESQCRIARSRFSLQATISEMRGRSKVAFA
ncbi:MAG: polysaccharide deacetylase family protein [Terriglobales bacterium]